MMRLLFLCVLLLLPAATVNSEEFEGSADDSDDEDIDEIKTTFVGGLKKTTEETSRTPFAEGSQAENKSQGNDGQTTLIISVAVVALVVLLVTAITAIMLKKRQKLKQQQGIYSVPTEQNQKETI